jgi:hypothetical protein
MYAPAIRCTKSCHTGSKASVGGAHGVFQTYEMEVTGSRFRFSQLQIQQQTQG